MQATAEKEEGGKTPSLIPEKRDRPIAILAGLGNEKEQQKFLAMINKATKLQLKISRPVSGTHICFYLAKVTLDEAQAAKEIVNKTDIKLPGGATLSMA